MQTTLVDVIKKKDINVIKIKERQNFINNLIPYAVKKGNKNKIENIFRTLLFYIIKNPQTFNDFNYNHILNSVKNITPSLGVKTKRKGSKNIYLPVPITKARGKFLASTWLIKNAKSKQNTKFYKNLSEEILESTFKKSISFKKCFELHKLAETSLSNIKIKLK